MAGPGDLGAADAVRGAGKGTETLSQFIARVLDQLSLSAWLPSVALVLSVTFVFQLAAALDDKNKPTNPGDAIGRALVAMAKISVGGALLLFAAVVVFTMLTQAFAFEAIRTLEGYWGTTAIVELVAQRRCAHFRKQRQGYQERYDELTGEAWTQARAAIEREQAEAIEHGNDKAEVREWTPDMLTYLSAKLLKHKSDVVLHGDTRLRALNLPWRTYAPADLLRRQVNLDKRLRDFPKPHRILPTRLGNVLRSHEDQTERERVETMIQEIYDILPTSVQNQHDEQRNRLDLYCSMTFVLAAVALVAAARLGPRHWFYAVAAVVTGFIAMWIAYRAAIASARAYGLLLVTIANRFPAPVSSPGS